MAKDAITMFKEAAAQLQREEAYLALEGTRKKNDEEQVVAKLGGAMVGKTVRALVEGPGREEGTLTARLDNNMTVDFAGGAPVGEFADVRVTGVRGAMLKGELA